MIKPGTIGDLAVSRAEKAILAGADGAIASPKLILLRKIPIVAKDYCYTGNTTDKICNNDQKRVASPNEALKMEHVPCYRKTYLHAKDPLAAYEEIKIEVSRS